FRGGRDPPKSASRGVRRVPSAPNLGRPAFGVDGPRRGANRPPPIGSVSACVSDGPFRGALRRYGGQGSVRRCILCRVGGCYENTRPTMGKQLGGENPEAVRGGGGSGAAVRGRRRRRR